MPVKIKIGIPEGDGADAPIGVMHVFYGRTEKEARQRAEAHGEICPRFGPAMKAGNVTESVWDIEESEWPTRSNPDADEAESEIEDDEEEIDEEEED